MTRPRLALLQRVAKDVAEAARRRSGDARPDPVPPRQPAPARPEADELGRRLDATRERLRREIPPTDV